jgi:hypothetical protein
MDSSSFANKLIEGVGTTAYVYPACLWRIANSVLKRVEIPSLVRQIMIVSMAACVTWLSS